MDFQIRNSYIKKFLGGFSHQNELKIVKYLTILGIHYLETCNNFNISFNELKKLTKNITKNCDKEDKILNKELNIIKKELVKLSQKFEEKLKDVPKPEPSNSKLVEENSVRSQSVPKDSNSVRQNIAQKPPSRWKETKHEKPETNLLPEQSIDKRRANSIGPSTPQLKRSKLSYDITPKPTEITFPRVDPRENRNYVTRHHLDDSQAKSTFVYQGVIFPEKDEKRGRSKTQENQKPVGKSVSPKKTKEEKDNLDAEIFKQRKSSTAGIISGHHLISAFDERSRSRSPKFAFPKEETFAKLNSPININTLGVERVPETGFHPPIQRSNRTETIHNQAPQGNQKITSKKFPPKSSRDKPANFGRSSNRSHLNQTHHERTSNDYHKVESKIRDEIKYHKELSKQYKKMRQSIQEYAESATEKFSNASSSQRKDKFVLVEKEDQRGFNRLYPFGQSSSYKPSGLLDSTSSPQKSLYFKQSASQYSNKSPSYSISLARSKQENHENLSQSKNSGGRGIGGMLDIANSFLNSPFMQHLSNLDARSSQMSPDSSVNKKTDRTEYNDSSTKNGNYRTPFEERKSPKKVTYRMEEPRNREFSQNYSKYSDWVGNYKNDKGNSSSILKDSENRRYNDYVGSLQQSKTESNSLASSNFSNFLNEDMKGFFQKENLELQRPKSFKPMKGSRDSSPTSIKPQDMTYNKNREVNNSYVKQNNYITPPSGNNQHQTNKSNIGESIDNGNVFKHERMSVTHLLNT